MCEEPLHGCHPYAGWQGCLAYWDLERLTDVAEGGEVKQGGRPSDCVSGSPCPSSRSTRGLRPTVLHASVVRPAFLMQATAHAARTLGSQRGRRRRFAVRGSSWSLLTSPRPTRRPRSLLPSRFPRPCRPLRPTVRLLVALRGEVNTNVAENENPITYLAVLSP